MKTLIRTTIKKDLILFFINSDSLIWFIIYKAQKRQDFEKLSLCGFDSDSIIKK